MCVVSSLYYIPGHSFPFSTSTWSRRTMLHVHTRHSGSWITLACPPPSTEEKKSFYFWTMDSFAGRAWHLRDSTTLLKCCPGVFPKAPRLTFDKAVHQQPLYIVLTSDILAAQYNPTSTPLSLSSNWHSMVCYNTNLNTIITIFQLCSLSPVHSSW